MLLIESGGDNLAANYSRELADFIIYVIDVAGGDKVPRKGGPGITGADVLCVNKCDLAGAVGADLGVMEGDARRMRGWGGGGSGGGGMGVGGGGGMGGGEGGPVIMSVVKEGKGVDEIVGLILSAWKASGGYDVSRERWKAQGGKKGSL